MSNRLRPGDPIGVRRRRDAIDPRQQIGSLAHEREAFLARDAAVREFLAKGGHILEPAVKGPRIPRVRNAITKRVYPCCWQDCEEPADKRIDVKVPHEAPQWPGQKLVYIFCSDRHKRNWLAGSPHANTA